MNKHFRVSGSTFLRLEELGVPASAVLRRAGLPQGFIDQPRVLLDTEELFALWRAYTALFGLATQDFFNYIQTDPSLLAGIPQLGRVAAYGGCLPIKIDGAIVGAIGVSGGTVPNDVDCAQAGLAVIKSPGFETTVE